ALESTNTERCRPSLPASDVQRISESVARYDAGELGGEVRHGRKRYEPKSQPWPEPPAAAAFRGLAGDVVATMRMHTEADDVALLITFMVTIGCAIGSTAYVAVGEARHGVNVNAVTVGIRHARARGI